GVVAGLRHAAEAARKPLRLHRWRARPGLVRAPAGRLLLRDVGWGTDGQRAGRGQAVSGGRPTGPGSHARSFEIRVRVGPPKETKIVPGTFSRRVDWR